MKKTLNENNNISSNNWKTILLIFASTLVGGFILIFSLLKNIENSQQIKIDPIPNANQLSKKKIEINTESEVFVIEAYIAEEEESRATGLMNVKELANDEGMLFIFPDSAIRSFWMKNTYIPLDIIFFDSKRKLINYHENAVPLDISKRYESDKPTKFVLELKAGSVEKYKLNSETTIKILE